MHLMVVWHRTWQRYMRWTVTEHVRQLVQERIRPVCYGGLAPLSVEGLLRRRINA